MLTKKDSFNSENEQLNIPQFPDNPTNVIKKNISILSSLKNKKLSQSNQNFHRALSIQSKNPDNCCPNPTTQSFFLFGNENINYKSMFTNSSFSIFGYDKDQNLVKENPFKYTTDSFRANYISKPSGVTNSEFLNQEILNYPEEAFFGGKPSTELEGKPSLKLQTKDFLIKKESNLDFLNDSLNESTQSNNTIHLKKKYKTIKKVYQCEHSQCKLIFKTLKQKLSHHKKMSPECKVDSIELISLISKIKKILIKLKNEGKVLVSQSLVEKYEAIMRKISMRDYSQIFAGHLFEEIKEEEPEF